MPEHRHRCRATTRGTTAARALPLTIVAASFVATVLVTTAGPARAQATAEPGRTTTLPRLTVTAPRLGAPAEDIPASVSVITAEEIAANPATTLPDLLARQTGIVVRDSSGSPDRSIDLRGFGVGGTQNTLILLNGQRISEVELQTAAFSSIPLGSIERIEVLRGTGAVLYGSGATAGVVNIITRPPQPNETAGALGGFVGSYATRGLNLNARTGSARVGLAIDANRYQSDNYRRNNRVEQENVQGEVRAFLDRGFVAFKFGRDAQDLRLPGERNARQLTGEGICSTGGAPDGGRRGTCRPNDYATRDGHRASLSAAHDLGGGARAEADFGYRDVARTSSLRDYSNSGFDTYTDTKVTALSFTPRVRMPWRLGRVANETTVGADWYDWDVKQRRASNQAALASPAADVLSTQRNGGLYVQNVSRFATDTTLSIGLRQERYSATARDTVNSASYASGEMTRKPIAWEIGVRQGITAGTSVFGRIGESFRYATVDEVYSQFGGPSFDSRVTLLEPQTSRDHEVGVEYRSMAHRLRASAFLYDLDNEIAYFAPTFSNVNLPPTRRQGFEIDGATTLARTVTLQAGFAAVRATFRDGVFNGNDVRGNTVPLVPRWSANAGIRWRVVPSVDLIANVRHVDKQRYDNDQANAFRELMPAYTLVDLRAAWRVARLTLGLGVDNLFDKDYYAYGICAQNFSTGRCEVAATANPFNGYPQRGRTFVASAEYRF